MWFQEQQSLDQVFLSDAVMDCLKDDVPEVVSAALKVVEVSDGPGLHSVLMTKTSVSVSQKPVLCPCLLLRSCLMIWTLKT